MPRHLATPPANPEAAGILENPDVRAWSTASLRRAGPWRALDKMLGHDV